MKHLGTRTIDTERLTLRRFLPSDAEAMFRNWANDPEVTRYLTWQPHGEPGVTAETLTSWIGSYAQDSFYQWAIVPKGEDGEPIGSISVVSMSDKALKAEIGYCIGKQWWGRGITAEALSAVIKFLIHEVGMQRIEAKHDAQNPNSGRVMRKCGMQYEGTLRKYGWNNTGICDTCIYSVLAEDIVLPDEL